MLLFHVGSCLQSAANRIWSGYEIMRRTEDVDVFNKERLTAGSVTFS